MEQLHFSNSNIELVCEEVGIFLTSVGVEKREALRTKLTLEELLLKYQAKFGQEANFRVKCIKRFFTLKVELVVKGQVYNPLEKTEEENALHDILAAIGLAPSYGYRNGKNYIIFTPKRKPVSSTVKMGVAIALAVVLGLLLHQLPAGINAGVNQYVLTPVTKAFMGLISAVAIPLIFLSILGSICSMGNMETLGKIGTKTIKVLLLDMVLISVIMTALACLFFPIQWEGGETSGFSQVLDLIYNIIPSNLFAPFVTGNTLQLVFIAVIVGLAMLVLSTRVSGIFKFVEQLSAIIQTIMSGLSGLLPVLICILFTGMISRGELGALFDSWKIAAFILLLLLVFYVLTVLYIALREKVSPKLLLKKTWKTTFIVLATASSAAAFQKNVRDCHKKFGIDKRLAEFGTSLGQILFSPADIAILLATEIGFAQMYGIAVTPQFLVVALITNLLLSFSIPPVPGGTLMGYTIAFTQLGIPLDVIGIVIALDTVLDFPLTACNASAWQLIMIDMADSLNMLDKETLHKKRWK